MYCLKAISPVLSAQRVPGSTRNVYILYIYIVKDILKYFSVTMEFTLEQNSLLLCLVLFPHCIELLILPFQLSTRFHLCRLAKAGEADGQQCHARFPLTTHLLIKKLQMSVCCRINSVSFLPSNVQIGV